MPAEGAPMKRVVVWGIGQAYETYLNNLMYEELKGNIKIVALITRLEDKYCRTKDGIEVITKDEVPGVAFDYLIVSALSQYDEIKQEAADIGIQQEKIVRIDLLSIPLMDLGLYFCLLENPVTILSDDCWGGMVYHYLKLPFSSPLINTRVDRGEFERLITDPLYYLSTELKVERPGDLTRGEFPIGFLGEGSNRIRIDFMHEESFEKAKKSWDRRIKRVNPDNLFVKMGFPSYIKEDEKTYCLQTFTAVKYKKILFYYGDEIVQDCLKTDRYLVTRKQKKRVDTHNYNTYCREECYYDLDILKLLLFGSDYRRTY